MISNFIKIKKLINDNYIKFRDHKFNEVIKNYSFIYVDQKIEYEKNTIIYQNFKNSKVVIINRFNEVNENEKYFIICFKKTIIIVCYSLLFLLHSLLTSNFDIKLYFLSDVQEDFNRYIKIDNSQNILKDDDLLKEEIVIFYKALNISTKLEQSIYKIWKTIRPNISAYFINEGYEKINQNRLKRFQEYFKNKENKFIKEVLDENEYIEIRNICITSSSGIELIYHIEREELFVLKKPIKNPESSKLIEREIDNYSVLDFPLLPKFIGTVQNKDHYIIEYINGHTLENIVSCQLDESDKMTIIFEIIMIFQYLHRKSFVYRDLKPNNIMIDQDKTVVLIDFDRMITITTGSDDGEYEHTADFGSDFVAPEIGNGIVSDKCDIYSIGQMIKYIIASNETNNNDSQIEEIYEMCTQENYKLRPSIDELFHLFLSSYHSKIKSSLLDNISEEIYKIGCLHYFGDQVPKDINKSIFYFTLASKYNHAKAQHILGFIYCTGNGVPIDIDKGIHYLTLAANQNDSDSIYNLGVIYEQGELIPRDIGKALNYYMLTANQNNPNALYNLGVLYERNDLVPRDMNKSIQYYLRAANQNDSRAMYNLGVLYERNELVPRDMNKSIQYYLRAANQNDSIAMYNLGVIYERNDFVPRDIDKAIRYFKLAAQQNDSDAFFCLGIIYQRGDYIPSDMEKAIHYYSLAANLNNSDAQYNLGMIYLGRKNINKAIKNLLLSANQNNSDAQFELGFIYESGVHVQRDIKKSIFYYLLAVNQNNSHAAKNLGILYEKSEYVKQDINKAIHYFTLASDLNDAEAQYHLSYIYESSGYVLRDINKAIEYLIRSANQNYAKAQSLLANYYLEGTYIPRDINKAIHYFSLAANQNEANAQNNLGVIYLENEHIPRDIDKAIHYFSLAANQNEAKAQYNLGVIYLEKEYIPRDIDKAIH